MIVFDVGANNGSSSISLAAGDPNVTVYAFEPTPELVRVMRDRTRHLLNYYVIPKAVGDQPGRARFHVAGQADWGCSSLRSFNDGLEQHWPGRTDFKVTHSIEVEVITLAQFVVERCIPQIDYLHIDVQGSDLAVLSGLGDKLQLVRAGDCEAAANSSVALYKDQHTVADVERFLATNGFVVDRLEPNDQFQNEMNVYFHRADLGNSGSSKH